MESQSLSCETVENGEAFCKCGEGWSCSITKTDDSKAAQPFCNCSGGTICQLLDESEVQKAVDGSLGCKVMCKSGAGYTCKVTKAGEVIVECGEGCVCIIDGETDNIKVSCSIKTPQTSQNIICSKTSSSSCC